MPTDWGELGGTERTGNVVHVGRGGLASRFASVWDVLLCGFDSPVEEGDGGGGGGGGGEDGFTVNWEKRRRERERERMRTSHSLFLACGTIERWSIYPL